MKAKIGWIIAGALFLLPGAVQADEMFDVREHLDKMKMELNLTPEQTQEVRPILEDYKDQMEQAKLDKKDKLDKVLDDEQMDKLDTLEQSWFDKMKSKLEGKDENADQETGRGADAERDSKTY